MSNQIPEKVINYNAYNENDKLVGVASETTLPTLEAMTQTVSGAGILGEYESPTPGHFSSAELEIAFRTLTDQNFSLAKNQGKNIILRAAQQSMDIAAGEFKSRPLKITFRGHPKNLNLGALNVGQPTESANVIEVLYLKIEEDGKKLLELDKLNFIFNINGEDMLANIRNQI